MRNFKIKRMKPSNYQGDKKRRRRRTIKKKESWIYEP